LHVFNSQNEAQTDRQYLELEKLSQNDLYEIILLPNLLVCPCHLLLNIEIHLRMTVLHYFLWIF